MVGFQGPRENIQETKDENDEKTSDETPGINSVEETSGIRNTDNDGIGEKGEEESSDDEKDENEVEKDDNK